MTPESSSDCRKRWRSDELDVRPFTVASAAVLCEASRRRRRGDDDGELDEEQEELKKTVMTDSLKKEMHREGTEETGRKGKEMGKESSLHKEIIEVKLLINPL